MMPFVRYAHKQIREHQSGKMSMAFPKLGDVRPVHIKMGSLLATMHKGNQKVAPLYQIVPQSKEARKTSLSSRGDESKRDTTLDSLNDNLPFRELVRLLIIHRANSSPMSESTMNSSRRILRCSHHFVKGIPLIPLRYQC